MGCPALPGVQWGRLELGAVEGGGARVRWGEGGEEVAAGVGQEEEEEQLGTMAKEEGLQV